MQEQFESMKSSFLKKISDMDEEFSQYKLQSRRKVYSLEEEFKQAQYLKDIFLRQLTEYQKIYHIN